MVNDRFGHKRRVPFTVMEELVQQFGMTFLEMNAGDVLLAISTSGNSKNVLKGIEAARENGMKVIGLTGKDGGAIGPLCDIEIRAPQSDYADRAQEIHIKVIHSLIHYVEERVKSD